MSKKIDEKYFDIRTRNRYLEKNIITKKDVHEFVTTLQNDEDNFELSLIDSEADEEIDIGSKLSEEEIESMPEISEDSINDFDFLTKSNPDSTKSDS